MEGTLAAAAAASEQRSRRRRPPGPRAAPWLVIPHGKGKKDQAFYNLCEPNSRTCRKFIPEMSRKSFWQKPSHQGWLVMLCDDDDYDDDDDDPYSNSNWNFGDCFLWNPVTLETIPLPNLLYWLNKPKQYRLRDCVLSSPPTSNNSDDDCMVFFLFDRLLNGIYDHILVFCRPGEDKKWRTKELSENIVEEADVQSVLCFKGKLYVMCENNWHLEIELQVGPDDDDDDEETHTLPIRSFYVSEDTFFPVIGGAAVNVEPYYLGSCDELFFIDISYNPRGFKKVVNSIDISRFDFSLMAWEEVKSLGDHVLFLGQKTTASCSATELGLTKGCLYYTLPEDQSLYKFQVEDNCTEVILPCLKLPTPWFPPEWMMMPMSVRVVDERRIDDTLRKDEKEDNIIEAEEDKTNINDDEKANHEGQKHNGRELEQETPWGNLNEDIVVLISRYMHPVDYIHFRAVCKANRSIIPAVNWRSSSTGITKTTYLSPWLVFSENSDTIYNFVDPMHNNEKYLMNLSELLVGATIRFSKGGWLLMSKGHYTLFFYNPFTKETIQLPDLQQGYDFPGISFSSTPTSSDCVVFAIAQWNENDISILSIARGNDIWRSSIYLNTNLPSYVDFIPCLNNPVFYGGAFYCLDYNGALGVFNLKDGFVWKILVKSQRQFNDVYPSFLVECDGKLLLVDLGPLGKSIGIFRLDFSKMVWVKVESLGKHVLFISNTSCLSATAPRSFMENKIYFPRLHGDGILFYSLDTGSYHSLGSQHSAKDFYDTTEWLNCTWIEPNWSRTTELELDWLTI